MTGDGLVVFNVITSNFLMLIFNPICPAYSCRWLFFSCLECVGVCVKGPPLVGQAARLLWRNKPASIQTRPIPDYTRIQDVRGGAYEARHVLKLENS